MNLTELYTNQRQPGKFGYIKYVKIEPGYTHRSFNIPMKLMQEDNDLSDRIFEVDKIETCLGLFKCADSCNTKCHAFYLKIDGISRCVCEFNLFDVEGTPLPIVD